MGIYDRDYMRDNLKPYRGKNGGQYIERNEEERLYFGFFESTVILVFLLFFTLFFGVRIASTNDWLSTPWIHENRKWFLWYVGPYDWVFMGFGILGGIGLLFNDSFWKGTFVLVFAGIVFVLLGSYFFDEIFSRKIIWRGEEGEPVYGYAFSAKQSPEGWARIGKPNNKLVYLVNNPEAKNPTWAQLVEFLAKDGTDLICYQPGKFVCADFAESLHNNAEKKGLRCGYVSVSLKDRNKPVFIGLLGAREPPPGGHALNVFKTTDKGLVFIDCTGQAFPANDKDKNDIGMDKVVDLKVGQVYKPMPLFQTFYNYEPMGVVKDCQITW